MKLKHLLALLGCTAAVLVSAAPVSAMGIVDATTTRQQGAAQPPQRQVPPPAAVAAGPAQEPGFWRDGEFMLVGIAAMALAARGIASRMR